MVSSIEFLCRQLNASEESGFTTIKLSCPALMYPLDLVRRLGIH